MNMDWDTVKDILSLLGWIIGFFLVAILLIGFVIGMKYLCAYIAEQLGIPYVWVL